MSAVPVAIEASLLRRRALLEQSGFVALCGVAGALQFSIAAAQVLLTVACVCWVAILLVDREAPEFPSFSWPLAAYVALTLVSTAFSPDPRASFGAVKQMVLFLIIPVAYRFATGPRASWLLTVVVTCAAASARTPWAPACRAPSGRRSTRWPCRAR